jgi:hypothetical protein
MTTFLFLGGLQKVYNNQVDNFARIFPNSCYFFWATSTCLMSLHHSLVAVKASNDYLNYRNYFLLTTLIVIVLQDININRIKRKGRNNSQNKNTISMEEIQTDDGRGGERYIDSVFDNTNVPRMDKVYNDVVKTDDDYDSDSDEEICFEIDERDSSKIKIQKPIQQQQQQQEINNIQIRPQFNNSISSRILDFINNNQKLFEIFFICFLLLLLLYSFIILVRSVTFSYFVIISLFIHPFALLIAFFMKKIEKKRINN